MSSCYHKYILLNTKHDSVLVGMCACGAPPLGSALAHTTGPPLKKWKSFRKKTALVSSSAIKLPFGFLICMCEPGDPAWAEGGAQPFLTSKRTPMRVDSEKQLLENGHRLWKNPFMLCKNTLHGKLICRRVIVSLSGKYTHTHCCF
jgi:hypothetical protein